MKKITKELLQALKNNGSTSWEDVKIVEERKDVSNLMDILLIDSHKAGFILTVWFDKNELTWQFHNILTIHSYMSLYVLEQVKKSIKEANLNIETMDAE